MRLLPVILKSKTNMDVLEIYFRFFREFSENDANKTELSFAKVLNPECIEQEQLIQQITSESLECLKIQTYKKVNKLPCESMDNWIACQAAEEFNIQTEKD